MKTKSMPRPAAPAPRRPAKSKPRQSQGSAPPHARVRAHLWQLRLYVTDSSPRSLTAFANLKKFCESHLKGRYRITVIDLLKHPHLAKGDQILAIPTVVRQLPKPVRIILGNLSDTARVLVGLDLRAVDEPRPTP